MTTIINTKEFKDSIKAGLFERSKYILENVQPIVLANLTENMSEHPWNKPQQIPFLSREDFTKLMMNWSVVEDPHFEANFGSTIKGPETLDFSTVNELTHGAQTQPQSVQDSTIDPVLASADIVDLLNMAYALDESEIEDYYEALVEESVPTIAVSLNDDTTADESAALDSLGQALTDGTCVRLVLGDGSFLDLNEEHIHRLVENQILLKSVINNLDCIEDVCNVLGINLSDAEPNEDETDQDETNQDETTEELPEGGE